MGNTLRRSVALVTAVSSIFALGACGNGASSSSDSNSITVWGGVAAEQGMQAVLDGFEKETGIKVDYTRFVNDTTGNAKLDTALMAGEDIDVFFTYNPPDLANRTESGIPADLSELDKDGLLDKISDYNVKFDGKSYAVPASVETYSVVYNKTAFEELGITIPENWTWDDLKEVAQQATHEENGKTIYGLAGDWHDEQQQVMGADPEYTSDDKPNFDNPGWKIKQYYYDMVYKDKSAYPFSQVMARKMYRNEYQLLLTGDALMAFYAPWMSRALNDTDQYPRDFQLGFAPLPKAEIPGAENGNYNAFANNWMQINSKSKKKEAAWKFIEYVATEGAAEYSKMGKLPVTDEYVSEDELIKNVLSDKADTIYDVQQFKDNVLNAERNYLVPTKFKGRAPMATAEQEEEQSYYLDSQTYDQYIANLTKRFEQELNK